jgi:hypothetical protein
MKEHGASIRKLLDVAYFASMTTEEGRPLQLRMVLVDDPELLEMFPSGRSISCISLGTPVPLTVANVTKLGMASDPWCSGLAVKFKDGEPVIWALIDQIVHLNLDLACESNLEGSPGGLGIQIVVTGVANIAVYHDNSFLARLVRDRVYSSEVDVFTSGPIQQLLMRPHKELKRKVARAAHVDPKNFTDFGIGVSGELLKTLRRLLIHIQRYGHGGAVLITSHNNKELFVKHCFHYSRLPELVVSVRKERVTEMQTDFAHLSLGTRRKTAPKDLLDAVRNSHLGLQYQTDGLTGAIKFVASLSRIDGLILCSENLTVRGFGVEIRTKREIQEVWVSSTPEPTPTTITSTNSSHFGTRHRSMMRYCHAHPGSVGFVISQDGDIRVMTQVGTKLVMWENIRVSDYNDFHLTRHLSKEEIRKQYAKQTASERRFLRAEILKSARQNANGVSPKEVRDRLYAEGSLDYFDHYVDGRSRIHGLMRELVNEKLLVKLSRGTYIATSATSDSQKRAPVSKIS